MFALSIGCPSGVGPEVSVRAVVANDLERDIVLVGDELVVARAAKICGVKRGVFRVSSSDVTTKDALASCASHAPKNSLLVYEPVAAPDLAESDVPFGAPTKKAGVAQLAWVRVACELALSGVVAAMITGPVSKDAIATSGAKGARGFIGHTEYLAKLCNVKSVTMAFWTEPFTSSLVTTHLRLKDVPKAVTRARVRTTIVQTAHFLARISREKPLTIAVTGVNPHAGEKGQFGDEELRVLGPAIIDARGELAREDMRVTILDPLPVEHAFRLAQKKEVAGVVAMYHDQATLAMKLMSFGEAVNVTLGLPIIRTSVDHGTAYDIAGTGKADARGMSEALALARLMTRTQS